MFDSHGQNLRGEQAGPVEGAAQDEAMLLGLLMSIEEEVAKGVGDKGVPPDRSQYLEPLEYVRMVPQNEVRPGARRYPRQTFLPWCW